MTALCHTVQPRHSPDSAGSAILRGQENQRQAKRSRAISPIKKKERDEEENNKKLLLLQICLPHLKKEGAIGAFYCGNIAKGTRGRTRVKGPSFAQYREE